MAMSSGLKERVPVNTAACLLLLTICLFHPSAAYVSLAPAESADSNPSAAGPEAAAVNAAAAATDPAWWHNHGKRRPYRPPYRPPKPGKSYCSCASPEAVPLTNGQTFRAASSTSGASSSSSYAGSSSGYGGYSHGSSGSGGGGNAKCYAMLPSVEAGGMCGAEIGVCAPGLCCSLRGFCSSDATSCDGTCQCAFSGPGSKCKGAFPLPQPSPSRLPTAKRGGVCGHYVARCPTGQCCSQFFFCVDDGSEYCKRRTCLPELSPGSGVCRPSQSKGKVIRLDWTVSWRNMSLDGAYRPVIVVNGEPFPTIKANVNDRLIVKVTNKLGQAMSIHWHGMLQYRTNGMDGVVAVTQRPLMNEETFVYNFLAATPGTYWWHSHFKTQYIDGLWGQLVIHDPDDEAYEADEVVTFNDWYHELSSKLLDWYLSPASGGNEPVPFDALLNGYGQGTCILDGTDDCGYSYVKGVASSCDDPKTKLRLINPSGFARFNFSIDGHRLIVVAEDGVPIERLEVGSIQLNAGQRYDVLPCQRPSKPGGVISTEPVWMRATMNDEDFAEDSNYNTSLGVLYFTEQQPTSLPTTEADFQPPALTPSQSGPGIINPYQDAKVLGGVVPPPATKNITFTIKFYNIPLQPNATQYAHMNLISLDMTPSAPSLLERISNNPANLGPPTNPPPPGGKGWHLVNVEAGDVVDIIIQNLDTGEHPLHLHGHWFFVMTAGLPGAGLYKGQELKPSIARDTVTVNLHSYVVMRYVAANLGSWIFHCHIDWHLAGGLGFIFQEGYPKNIR